jgi:putative ABC transport system permease protein
MTFKNSFKTALRGLQAHKSRSALTILGIVIGITAIMLIMSLGQGAENLILGEIGSMGAETIVIRPGQEPQGPTDVPQALFADSLKDRDIRALKNKNNVPELIDIAPAVIVPGSVAYLGETYRAMTFGWTARFMAEVFDLYPEKGVLFDETDIRQRSFVAVIGSKVKQELFGESQALGKNIKIKNQKFRVIGVYAPKGQMAFFNDDEIVILPYTTARDFLLGIDYYHEIVVRVANPEAVARTVRDIELTLRASHNITDPEKDDFFVVTQASVIKQIQTIIGTLTLFLSLVVAIALVVGGVGIMNIMLVAVTERTREIGLRKALGATEKDILIQFLLEATILTAIGGLIGIILGTTFSLLASMILTKFAGLNWVFTFPIGAAILGLGVSTAVGLIFGLYPARQASLKSPIEALRYE